MKKRSTIERIKNLLTEIKSVEFKLKTHKGTLKSDGNYQIIYNSVYSNSSFRKTKQW